MKARISHKKLVYICALTTTIGGAVFLVPYANTLKREELDMYRIVESEMLEGALEQYLLIESLKKKKSLTEQSNETE